MIHFFFFFNDTATTEIYTLSLHDALPICAARALNEDHRRSDHDKPIPRYRHQRLALGGALQRQEDRKSTRLNSSHSQISYAVFCLKKKNINYLYDTL